MAKIKKNTIQNFLGINYRTFFSVTYPADDFDTLKGDKPHFAAYISNLDSSVNTDIAFSHFFEPNTLNITAVKNPEDLTDDEKNNLKVKYEGFTTYISKYIKPADSIDTFKYFLEKNSVADLTKTTELTNLFNAVAGKKKSKSSGAVTKEYVEVTSMKNHPKTSWLAKKIGIPVGIGSLVYLISRGALNASNLVAGDKFMGIFTVGSNLEYTALTMGSVALLATPVIAATTVVLKNAITKKYYQSKYGSVEKIVSGEKDLQVLMNKINATSQEIVNLQETKNPLKVFKRYLLTKTNRNRLHHVVNTTKTITDMIETCEDATQKLRMQNFVTSVYKFSETNLNLQRTKYATKMNGRYLSENIDIFAKLNKYCDATPSKKFEDIEQAKKKMERSVFYCGLKDLEAYTNLTKADLNAIRDTRLGILPENDNLDPNLIPTTLTTDNQEELKKNRKEGLTKQEFTDRIAFLQNVETLLADTIYTSIPNADDKNEIEKLIKDGKITKLAEITQKLTELQSARSNKADALKQEKIDYFNQEFASLNNEVKTILQTKVDPTNASETLDQFKANCASQLANALKDAKVAYINSQPADFVTHLQSLLSADVANSALSYTDFITKCDSKFPQAVVLAKKKYISDLYSSKKISTTSYNSLLPKTTDASETYEDFKLICTIEENSAVVLKTTKQNIFNANSSALTAKGLSTTTINAIKSKIKDPDISEADFQNEINSALSVRNTGLIAALTSKLIAIKTGASSDSLIIKRTPDLSKGTIISELDMDNSVSVEKSNVYYKTKIAREIKDLVIAKYRSADPSLASLTDADFKVQFEGDTFIY